ncbi:Smr/MutS family protein [Mesonia maritima]|uniref:DsDNA-specific endonuclease/ATPase MutS2 n=1 Tax=Mesonia maritima TaxID=1793873 RepID=A0ABU1K9D4_9FLAO|nr:Smr/MutS family protein [Mesonia maritima]MDR6302214.1 dsDNA-specific endonuclease/ATPase MutS2 [Mesonia maritima]
MTLNKGDLVEVIDEPIGGRILEIEGDEVVIETEEGFPMRFNITEIVKVATDEIKVDYDEMMEAMKEKKIKKKKTSSRIKPKERSAPPLEVDLHIHKLTDRDKNLSNFEMLNIQLDTARGQLEFAIRKRIQKVVFIHGVGQGVLRAELETLLSRYDNLKFYDADFQKYGVGATEVYIFQNP